MMSILVLLASTSFTVGLHFCMGSVKNIALSEHAESCHHKKLPPCHQQKAEACCDDITVKHDNDGFEFTTLGDTLNPPVLQPETLHQAFLVSIIIPETQGEQSPFIDYDIPILSSDRTISNRVLLI